MTNNMDPGLTVIHLGIWLGIGENRHFLAFEIFKKNRNNSEIFHRQKNRHFYNSGWNSTARLARLNSLDKVKRVESCWDEKSGI